MAWLGALAMLFGVAPAVAATAAYAAPAVAPAFNLNGAWTDNGTSRPVINVTSTGAILIDMSSMHRPNATGTVLSSTTAISVTFPDDATYTATIDPSGTGSLHWSNGSTWTLIPSF